MKVEKLMQILKRSLVCTMACFIPVSFVYSSNDNEIEVEDQEWGENSTGEKRNTITPTFNIHLQNGSIEIYNALPYYDLNIAIINNVTGEEVYHTQVNKEVSSYIVLPISALGAGQYRLTISNPTAGYAFAYFNL